AGGDEDVVGGDVDAAAGQNSLAQQVDEKRVILVDGVADRVRQVLGVHGCAQSSGPGQSGELFRVDLTGDERVWVGLPVLRLGDLRQMPVRNRTDLGLPVDGSVGQSCPVV